MKDELFIKIKGLPIIEFDRNLLAQDVFDIDFNGSCMLQITNENGAFIITNAMNGYGQNCFKDFKGEKVSFLDYYDYALDDGINEKYKKHWAAYLQPGHRVMATIRHESDGSLNEFDVPVIVVSVHENYIMGSVEGDVIEIPFNELNNPSELVDIAQLKEFDFYILKLREHESIAINFSDDEQYKGYSFYKSNLGWHINPCKIGKGWVTNSKDCIDFTKSFLVAIDNADQTK